MTLKEALRSYRFWILFASILCVYMSVSGISPNLIPALTDNGMSATQAATVQGVYGVTIIVGRLVVGYLSTASGHRQLLPWRCLCPSSAASC